MADNGYTSKKVLNEVQRALGIIEGVASTLDAQRKDTLTFAVGMIENVLRKSRQTSTGKEE